MSAAAITCILPAYNEAPRIAAVLDAVAGHDLIGIAPVSDGRAHASISLRRNSPWPWRALGIDYISGERVMPRAVLADQLDALLALPRFGLEVFMNDLWLEAGFDIAVVRWPEVDSPLKSAKHGKLAGIAADVKMMRDIFRTIPAHHTLRQIFTMRARRI
ncbi:MAG: hypothetical protein P8X51_05330 [Maritimibacter sp.]